MQRFSLDAVPVTLWKNGGGVTREIVVWPPKADIEHFEWRVSVATISASGPFSTFPGIERVIMLLQGDGMVLRGTHLHHQLSQLYVPWSFSGDLAIDCRLLGSPSTDFNVMTRIGRTSAAVRVIHDAEQLTGSKAGLIMSLEGNWSVDGEPLARYQGVWWADEKRTPTLAQRNEAAASLVVVTWCAD